MDASSGQSQQMSSQSSLENMLVCSTQQEKKPKPQPEQAQKCPRCDSTNTKFCYYNNYSLSQPRYFCKSCRRYWTKGGTLRNVPVGGGCRKNKRSSSSSKRVQDQPFSPNINPFNSLPLSSYDHSSDLTLALARLQKGGGQLSYDGHHDELSVLGNPTNSFGDILGNSISSLNSFDALRSGFLGSGTTQYNNHHNNSNNNAVQNMYGVYNGNGDSTGEVNSSCGVQMMFPYEQEMNNAVTNNTASENKVFGGFPWQQLNGGTNMSEVESGRGNWNGFTTSSWHGLLNSTPLI